MNQKDESGKGDVRVRGTLFEPLEAVDVSEGVQLLVGCGYD